MAERDGPKRGPGRTLLALVLLSVVVGLGLLAALNRPAPEDAPASPSSSEPATGVTGGAPRREPPPAVPAPGSGAGSGAVARPGEKPSPPEAASEPTPDLPPGHPPIPAAPGEQVGLQWLGHSCFYIHSPRGVTVVTDPFDPAVVPLPPPEIGSHFVLVSRKDPAHDHTQVIRSFPGETRSVLRGGEARKGDVVVDSREVSPGRGWIYRIRSGPLRVAHVGGLTGGIPDELASWLGPIDVLLLPVGQERPTAEAAVAIAKRLAPRLIIPMAYSTADMRAAGSRLRGVDAFIRLGPWAVTAKDADVIMTSPSELPPGTEVMTLQCRGR